MKQAICVFMLSAAAATAQVSVTGAKINADPEPRVRPFETLMLQIRVYGQRSNATGTEMGRLLRGGPKVTVADGGGWISKPFKYPGKDDETFLQERASTFGGIFQTLTKDYVVQDTVLYTAPEKPGKYKVSADIEGQKGELEIEVSDSAPSHKKPEKITFPAEHVSADPYRKLAEHWSPLFAQETWWQPKADIPTRFDYDGDWQGDNNWDDLEDGTSQAYIYYAAMETETHWFLHYNVFHPRDYSDKCVVGTCHENDNEGLILTVRKDGSEFGKLELMETLAHNNVYSFSNERGIGKNIHNIDAGIDFYQDSHPVVFIESGGHGIQGAQGPHSGYRFSGDTFAAGTGMTLVYKASADRPRHPNDRQVGYELLPIYDHWWTKACQQESGWQERTFDEYMTYEPVGGRPTTPCRLIGTTFYGRKESSNKAKPFWGWHDIATQKKKALGTGQWALDPAYSIQQSLRFPSDKPISLKYIYNPYLGIGVPLATAGR
ncbi:MAG: hypothetical protein ABI972_15745 [Acidobacteriota bacterium]